MIARTPSGAEAIFSLRLRISAAAMPILGVGALLWLSARGRTRSLGAVLAGFGLIFVGIDYLQTLALQRTPAAAARAGLDTLLWADGALYHAWRLVESLRNASGTQRTRITGSAWGNRLTADHQVRRRCARRAADGGRRFRPVPLYWVRGSRVDSQEHHEPHRAQGRANSRYRRRIDAGRAHRCGLGDHSAMPRVAEGPIG